MWIFSLQIFQRLLLDGVSVVNADLKLTKNLALGDERSFNNWKTARTTDAAAQI